MGKDQLTIMPDGKGFINVHEKRTELSQFLPHLIPLEYTGRNDDDGKEIYEEDTVSHDSGTDKVIFDGGMFQLSKHDGRPLHEYSNVKVIGNGYENPLEAEHDDQKA